MNKEKEIESILISLLKQKKTKLNNKLYDIRQDDGTRYGENMLEKTLREVGLVDSLLEIFN